jgi:hypothetical protein
MSCEFKYKNYCFHPERANGDLLAINCVYNWLNDDNSKVRRNVE